MLFEDLFISKEYLHHTTSLCCALAIASFRLVQTRFTSYSRHGHNVIQFKRLQCVLDSYCMCINDWLVSLHRRISYLTQISESKQLKKLNLIQAAVTVDTFNNGKLDSTEDYYFTFIILLILYSFFPDFSSIRYIHAHTHTVCAHNMPEYLTFTTKMSTMNSFLLLRSFGILRAHSAILSYYRAAA